ncbi:Tubulin-specific chaperone cofactor E-like protein [Bagarius yarrelli]|uniref:Tubulin-specific chaperone cofactor E-like protein n=1 Tax=Bagarius yarrelli TaxID=175774 RepID=A0A556TV40_BAGYA|nr:Tubulin-specific chaperone cofactor E-like protein [Bagarius yarrelli]
MDMDMEDEIGRTLVQVISEKYNPDNFPYCRGPGAGVVIRTSPQGSPVKDRLNLPSVLVLDSCGISHAGDEEDVAAFCAHVVELDLSHNQFTDWGEISKILSNIPHLDFLNLSMNPLSSSSLDSGGAEAFSSLRRLVLNNTHISWDMVHMLTQEIPELEELFLCLNEYECVNMSRVPCPSLRLLHITDNQLHDWGEVRKLGLLYPRLTSLILANNSLSSIHEPEDSLQCLFPNLHSINLHNSGLNGWEDIEKLNFFPKLCEIRLMGIPLLQPYTDQERRYLTIAQFHNLVAHYGRLAPLADVDLRPLSCAQVELHFGDNTKQLELRLDQTVADLKKQLRPVVQLPVNKMRVYYIDRQMGYALAPQELKYGARALHSYSIRDGDEILVVPKSQ